MGIQQQPDILTNYLNIHIGWISACVGMTLFY
jgi:hypothetical protein